MVEIGRERFFLFVWAGASHAFAMKILFLDFDGCLHADDVYLADGVPVMRRDGAQLFEHANLLAELLEPYPQVQIVLSTSWVAKFGMTRARLYLPEVLQQRVAGTTHEYRTDKHEWMELSRFDQVMRYVRGKNLQSWLALDGDNHCWPECFERHLVCPMPRFGLGEARVRTELADRLEQMCNDGGHGSQMTALFPKSTLRSERA